jgi:hypothetical protein
MVVVVAGFGLGFAVAHLLSGSIAYWGIVSGPFLLTLRVAIPATVIAGVAGVSDPSWRARSRLQRHRMHYCGDGGGLPVLPARRPLRHRGG